MTLGEVEARILLDTVKKLIEKYESGGRTYYLSRAKFYLTICIRRVNTKEKP